MISGFVDLNSLIIVCLGFVVLITGFCLNNGFHPGSLLLESINSAYLGKVRHLTYGRNI